MPLVHGAVTVDRQFDAATATLLAGRTSWLADAATAATTGPGAGTSAPPAVELGRPRSTDRAVVVPMLFIATEGPFSTLDGDLRLEPDPDGARVSLSGRYIRSVDHGAHNGLGSQRRTEGCVGDFLRRVAARLEQRNGEL